MESMALMASSKGPDEEVESSCLLDSLLEAFLLGGLSASWVV